MPKKKTPKPKGDPRSSEETCPSCATKFLRVAYGLASRGVWPQYANHVRACAKASPEQRAFWLKLGRWPRPGQSLSVVKLDGAPRPRERAITPEVGQ
jgi:hypothetical protein